MLMELLLLKDLFARPEVPLNREKWSGSTSSGIAFSSEPQRGCHTWTKRGEWIPGSLSEKTRLIFAGYPQGFIAMQDSEPRSLFQRIRDHFTHIKVYTLGKNGKKETLSLHLWSLSKRTQLTVATLLFLRFTGKLTLDYVEKSVRKVQERNEIYDRIIASSRARALDKGKSPDQTAQNVKRFLSSIAKSQLVFKGMFAMIEGDRFVAHRDRQFRLTLGEQGKLIGHGSWGNVYEFLNYSTGETDALKIAAEPKQKFNFSISNEYKVLTRIHKNGPIDGIQQPPYFLVHYRGIGKTIAYVTKKFPHSLSNLCDPLYLKEIKRTLELTLKEKVVEARTLFEALRYQHEEDKSVHGDIKPGNCHWDDHVMKFNDYGDCRKKEEVTLDYPLGIWTPLFTSLTDQLENERLTYLWHLHRWALGEITGSFEQASILKKALRHPTIKLNKAAARFSLAEILGKLKVQELKELGLDVKDYKDELDLLRTNPKEFSRRKLKISQCRLTSEQLAEMKEKSILLCSAHDVYGLAMTLLCYFTKRQGPVLLKKEVEKKSSKEIEKAIRTNIDGCLMSLADMLREDPACNSCAAALPNLLRDMLLEETSQRPTAAQARDRYLALLP